MARARTAPVTIATFVSHAMFAGVSQTTATTLRYENFDVPPVNWEARNPPGFPVSIGYSASNFAGGATGEAGGRFYRADSQAYYADKTIGVLTLDEAWHAEGRIVSPQVQSLTAGWYLGFFDLLGSFGSGYVGLHFKDDGAGGLAWGLRAVFGSNAPITAVVPLGTGVAGLWSLDYDPNAGSYGRLSATISGIPGGGSIALDLTPAIRNNSYAITAFGLLAQDASSPTTDRWGDFFIDDVTYSVEFNPIPGDANGDGCVSGADFTIWADNFDDGTGPGGKTWRDGDWTGEGYVTGADFTIWSDHFGEGCAPTSVVPEPLTLFLLFAALAITSVRAARG